MKVTKKLDLENDFNEKLQQRLDDIEAHPFEETKTKLRQGLIVEVRSIAQQAYKLGQENPND